MLCDTCALHCIGYIQVHVQVWWCGIFVCVCHLTLKPSPPLFFLQDSYPGRSNERTLLIPPQQHRRSDPPPPVNSFTLDDFPTTPIRSKQKKKKKEVELPSKDYDVSKLLVLRCHSDLLGSNSPSFLLFPIFLAFLPWILSLPTSNLLPSFLPFACYFP